MSERTDHSGIVLAGARNFRDLGGYRTAESRMVRRGRVFRSEVLSHLSSVDLARIRELDIRLVCDLRTADERLRQPNRWPVGSIPDALTSLGGTHMPAVGTAHWQERLADPTFDAINAREWLLNAYLGMPRAYSDRLAAIFERLAASGAPTLLVHCAAGKDRTGFVSAMFLWALGVPWPTIVEDYLRSSRRQPPVELARKVWGRDPAELSDRARMALYTIADVNVDYLTASFDAAAQEFSSVDGYLENACGLDPGRRDCLRAQLLID